MKLKSLLVIGVALLLVFLIYLATLDRKVYYLALGDSLAAGINPYLDQDYGYTDYVNDYLKDQDLLEKYISQFASDGYRVVDLLHDIEDNRSIVIDNKSQTIKNALIKADLITLSIGNEELLYKINRGIIDVNSAYEYVDGLLLDMDELFSKMREYCKEDVMVLSFYNPYESVSDDVLDVFDYANSRLKQLCDKYKISYIDIYSVFSNSNYFVNPNSNFPSKEGYQKIAEQLISKMDGTLLNE